MTTKRRLQQQRKRCCWPFFLQLPKRMIRIVLRGNGTGSKGSTKAVLAGVVSTIATTVALVAYGRLFFAAFSRGAVDSHPSESALIAMGAAARNDGQRQQRQQHHHHHHHGGNHRNRDGGGENGAPASSTFVTNPSPQNSFGCCLMIMDDNHFLVEWIAYHWYTLPLRHMVVLIDEKSRTSPASIFERWTSKGPAAPGSSGLMDDILVVNWTYPDAYSETPERQVHTAHANPENRKIIGTQLKFYEDCMKWYKASGWEGWVAFTDTDEYLSVRMQQRPEAATSTAADGSSNAGTDGTAPVIPDASISEHGSVMRTLNVMTGLSKNDDGTASGKRRLEHEHCVSAPRYAICMDYETPRSSSSSDQFVPEPLLPMEFVTTRWLFASNRARPPKNLVNVGAISRGYFDQLDLLEQGGRPHYVAPGLCEHRMLKNAAESPFRIYHYPGSKEQRMFRHDPRGQFGNRSGGSTPEVCDESEMRFAGDLRPWLTGFVNAVGIDEAKRLLEGAGRVGPWPAYNTEEKSLT